MAKINFSKVENNFDLALRKMLIDRLAELATIVALIQDPNSKISNDKGSQVLQNFNQELQKLKERDKKIYEALNLKEEEELNFKKPLEKLTPQDWQTLKELKEKIEDLKKDLYGQQSVSVEKDEEHIEQQRLKHINKRFNIREDWLPLH